MAAFKVLVKYTVYPGHPRATELSRTLEVKKGRLGAAVGFVLFIGGLTAMGGLISAGLSTPAVMFGLLFALALAILVPVMLEVNRQDRYKALIDQDLGTPPEQRYAPRFPKVRRYSLIALAALGALFVAVWVITGAASSSGYHDAVAMMEEGRYEEALAAFEAMGDYRDAKDQAKEARYQWGLATLEAGDYDQAILILQKLRSREANDAIEQARQARSVLREETLAQVNAHVEAGDYRAAADLIETLGDYSEARELSREVHFLAGRQAMEAGDYAEAETLFAAAGDYAGAEDALRESILKQAEALAEAGDALAAAEAYDRGGDAEAAAALRYDHAGALLAAGDYEQAYRLYAALGNYRDVPERLTADTNLRAMGLRFATEPGSTVCLGAWEQDGDAGNGPEPLFWTVIESNGGRSLLMTEKIIAELPYNQDETVPAWQKTSLFAWLNDTFFAEAFTDDEQAAIADAAFTDGNAKGSCRVSVMDHDLAYKRWVSDHSLAAQATEAALSGVDAADEEAMEDALSWWTVDYGRRNDVLFVSQSGNPQYSATQVNEAKGVRPVVWLVLPKGDGE